MANAFDAPNANTIGRMTAPLAPKFDQDGGVYRAARAHTTLTLNTPYRISYDEYGPLTAAFADDADTFRIGVAQEAALTGAVTWLKTGGYCAGVITPSLSVSVGHALGMRGGAIVDIGADFDDLHDDAWAICTAETSSATAHNVILLDEPITAST